MQVKLTSFHFLEKDRKIVSHSTILKVLNLFKISPVLINFLWINMSMWKTTLDLTYQNGSLKSKPKKNKLWYFYVKIFSLVCSVFIIQHVYCIMNNYVWLGYVSQDTSSIIQPYREILLPSLGQWWEKYLSKHSLIIHTCSWRDKLIVASGIFQGNSLSPSPFCLSFIPL